MTVSFLLMPGASVLVSTRMQVLNSSGCSNVRWRSAGSWKKLLPNVKFHYVANAGHQVQNDHPQLVPKLMMDFLAA